MPIRWFRKFGWNSTSRPSLFRRPVDETLSRHQEALRAVLVVVIMGLAGLLLVRALIPCVKGLVRGWYHETIDVGWQDDVRGDGDQPTAEYKRANGNRTRATEGIDLPGPDLDWNDSQLRRQAASILCLHGDYREGIELLRPGDPDRRELLDLTENQHKKVLRALKEILREEVQRLQLEPGISWKGPPSDTNFANDSIAQVLWNVGKALPDPLLFRAVVNLHVNLRDRTGAPDAYLKLLFESCFSRGSRARRLYVESDPKEYRTAQVTHPSG